MGKLTTDQTKDLEAIGIKGVKTEDDAKKKLVEYLGKNDIDGVDKDPYEDLYEMSKTIFEGSPQELDQAAAEKNDQPKGKKDKKDKNSDKSPAASSAEEEAPEEEAAAEPTEEDMQTALIDNGMKKKEAKALTGKKLKKAFDALPKPEPAKADKKADKKSDKKADAPKAEAAKSDKKADKKDKPAKTGKVSKKINPKENPEDAKLFEDFKAQVTKALKGHEIKYDFIANGGISIRVVGKNGSKVFLSYDTPKMVEGEMVATAYFGSIKDEKVLQQMFGDDAEIVESWSKRKGIANCTLNEIVAAFKGNAEVVGKEIDRIVKKDEKLGKNREKMEDDLKDKKAEKIESIKNKNKDSKKAAKEEPAPEPEAKADKKSDKKDKKSDKGKPAPEEKSEKKSDKKDKKKDKKK